MELEVCVCGGLAGAERGSIPIKASLLAPSRLRPSSTSLRKIESTSYSKVLGNQKGWMSAPQRFLPFTTLVLIPVAIYFVLSCRLQGGTLSILCHRFMESKDAGIVEPIVELDKALEDESNIKSQSPPSSKVDFNLLNPSEENSNLTDRTVEVQESRCSDSVNVEIPQVVATSKSKESEHSAKVGGQESSSEKDSDVYIVRAEPKVLDAKQSNASPDTAEIQSKTEENSPTEERKVVEPTVASQTSPDISQSDEKIKTVSQASESGPSKDNVNVVGEPPSPIPVDDPASTTPPEPSTTPSTTSASEDMPSFSEWTQKRLEEAERRKVQNDTTGQGGSEGSGSTASHSSGFVGSNSNGGGSSGGSVNGATLSTGSSATGSSDGNSGNVVGTVTGNSKVRQKNYASPDCGAKIAASNPEAVSPSSVLSPSRDEYLLNACSSRIWFVVELCEAIRAKKIELANFELFSSSPKDFSVWISDRFPTREWSLVGRFTAQDERTLQSFHLDPHLFTKFIKVEFHSHYGSEHFCPVSLFRVYGTSEFEVLETEQDDDDDSVGRPRDASGSLIGEDDGEDSDEEEPLDIETGGPPRNLFGSARDAVLSIVKKAAEALVKAGDSANETITLATESPIKEDEKNEVTEPTADGEEAERSLDENAEQVTKCKTLRRPPVCHGCEESVILRAAALLSCHYDTLRPLTSSPFVRSALASGGLCMTRFGLPLSAPNHSSSTTATDGGYISALLPTEYLVALCNALITPDMVRDTDLGLSEPSATESLPVSETQTGSLALESQKVTEGTILTDSTPAVASMIKPTRTLKGDGVESGGRGESVRDSGGSEEVSSGLVTSSPTTEIPQSTSMPSLSSLGSGGTQFRDTLESVGSEESATGNVGMETAVSMEKQEPADPGGFSLDREGDSVVQEVLESERMQSSSVTEAVNGVVSPTITSAPSTSIHPSQTSSSSSVPVVSPPQPTGDASVVQPSQATGTKTADGVVHVPVTPPSPTPSTPQAQPITNGQGSAKGSETANSPPPPPVPSSAQKESVFVRLSNRIKILERNMSLSAQYLEELSRRYRKQFEEAQKHAVEAQKRDRRLAEDAANLQARLDILAEAVKGLVDARKREEEQRMKEKEEEEARKREEQEYGENFPWWGAFFYWVWNAAGRAAIAVAQHGAIFCIELIVLWAVMGQYQRRRLGWTGVTTAPLETDVQAGLQVDDPNQLKYSSLRKRRKDDWTETTEIGRSPRKRRPTNEDVGVSDSGIVSLEVNACQHQQKQRRRRRKLKSSSTTSLSFTPQISLPIPDSQFPPPYSETQSMVTTPVENLNGWMWPSHGMESIQKASVLEEGVSKPETVEDDSSSKTGSGDKINPKSISDGTAKVGFSKSKSRRVSAPFFFQEDNGTLTKKSETTTPLSRSSSQIHSSLRVCSPKLKADNWEWFTGARLSGEFGSKGSRAVGNKNSKSASSQVGDGVCPPSDTGARGSSAGSSSPTPSTSSKNKDKKGSSSGSSGSGGSSLKRIVKRFF